MENENVGRTVLRLPSTIPTAYWDGYFEQVGEHVDGTVEIRSFRAGATGQSDAQYVIDRCASGLHFGITVVGTDLYNERGL